jgi:serine/threonine-protein kinase
MEFLDGKDLGAWLRDGGVLSRTEIAALVADVTRGLAAAHQADVVHRDIKPRNVVRVATPAGVTWKVVDFGVAKLVDHGSHTTGHVIVGTPSYMAPEQAAGQKVDARTDLYALGLIIYRLLVGRPAFVGDRIRTDQEPPDPRPDGGLSDDLELVLRIALAPQRDDRFATAEEMGAAFADAWVDRLAPALRARGARVRDRHPWHLA